MSPGTGRSRVTGRRGTGVGALGVGAPGGNRAGGGGKAPGVEAPGVDDEAPLPSTSTISQSDSEYVDTPDICEPEFTDTPGVEALGPVASSADMLAGLCTEGWASQRRASKLERNELR